MLQLINIEKKYTTGDLTQAALNGVSLNLRDSEFVAILGPSGSGKTTLLNIIGGLDRYDSGELIINGISTRRYTDRDWDSYRNHTVGFVFQSYNLIPHQTVLANVELALTISGVSGAERRRRAAEALRQVGLGDQLHKRPTEMSGGQMQRVAIARALVNNPDILLADEPTGALDSETSIQVMELLKDVAKDRLVVMVTHNPELAEQYANRIVRLRDGLITDDTRPFEPDDTKLAPPIHKNMGRSSMSLLTSLALSFNNLRTKKARTLLTAFAGSIGIIGIALIISLSAGVNAYIADMERSTLSEYPLQILSSGVDITSFLSSGSSDGTTATGLPTDEDGKKDTSGGVEGMVSVRQLITKMVSGLTSNDLTSLKKYLESDESTIAEDATSIEYSYSAQPQIYRQDADGSVHQVNPDSTLSMLGLGNSGSSSTSVTSSLMNSVGSNTSVFYQLPANSDLYRSQYEVKAGRWPEKPTECVMVLSKYGTVTDYALYSMGLRDSAELDKMIQQFAQNQSVDVPSDFRTYSYDELLGLKFKLVNSADTYVYDETYKVWKSKADDKEYMQQLVENGEDITIVGIVQPDYTASASMLTSGIAYPASLTEKVMEDAADSDIVKQQMADPTTNVLTGESFGKAESIRDFDLASLFSIDTNALKDAFQFDAAALDFDLNGAFDLSSGSFDLSSLLDFSDFSLNIDELPDIDLSEALAGLDLSVSPEALQDLVQKIFKDYKKYIIGNGILNFKNWSFSAYLKTERFQKLLAESMKELVDPDKLQGQLSEALQATIRTVMDTYSDQITAVLKEQLDAALQKGIATFQDQIQTQLKTAIQQNIGKLSSQMEGAIQLNMTTSELTELMRSTLRSSSATYEANLTAFGYADEDTPSQIKIYPKDFASKAVILEKLDAYNAGMSAKGEDEKVVQYTDLVGTLMTSVTEIVNMISSMMVAFVSISLAVSSIMIGVITYISVLERRKEIGILRAIGASKRNISEVFNAETFIIGLCSGIMGIVLSEILLIPGNIIIQKVSGTSTLVAALPVDAALFLVALATLLTILAGIIPARGAAKSNPVKALRSE
ncbi:MAG: ABC transporter [Faecalibacterium prausnitzii]|nr:MAG: ABC transporter [Faecalibacterium prausnitzii]